MFDTEKFISLIRERPALYDMKAKKYERFSNREIKLLRSKLWLEVGQEVIVGWAEMGSEEKDKAVKELMKKWKNIKDCYIKELRAEAKSARGQLSRKKRRYIHYDLMTFLHSAVAYSHDRNATSNEEEFEVTHFKEDIEEDTRIISYNEDTEEVTKMRSYNEDTADVTKTRSYNEDTEEDTNMKSAQRKSMRRKTRDVNYEISEDSEEETTSSKRKPMTKNPQNGSFEIVQITDILKESLQGQNKKNDGEDAEGNRAFLMSFVPIMNAMAPELAMETRYQITNIFRNIQRSSITNGGNPLLY